MKKVTAMSDKEIVLQKVWNLVDIVREDASIDDYHIVLLFIYLRSENLIAEHLLNEPYPKHAFIQLLQNAESESIQKVFDVFAPSIQLVSERSLKKVVDLLFSIEWQWLNENIAIVFDESLEGILLSQGRRQGGEFIQPKQLTDFLNALAGSTAGLRVFNPFAGVASLIKNCTNSSLVYAQELNQKTWAIGQLRLIVHKIAADFKCEDSIANWPHQDKFDLIVANPPFGMRLNEFYREQYPYLRTAEELLLNIGLDSLSSTGKLITVLPQGFLFSGGSKRLRKQFIEEDLIDTIISFPGGILHHTGIPVIVLFLNKAKEIKGKIRLIEANACVSSLSKREKIIEVEKLLQFTQQIENTDAVRLITNKEVISNGFNLNLPLYFQDDIDGVKLKDLLTPFRGGTNDLPKKGKFIRSIDLLKHGNRLNIQEIDSRTLDISHVKRINESCLLVASKWYELLPTYFEYDNESIFHDLQIRAFHVDRTKIDVDYLLNEFKEEYVLRQLHSFSSGSAMPIIRRDDLLEIKLKLPSLLEQRVKLDQIRLNRAQLSQLRYEFDIARTNIEKREFNEFASLKHTLGTPRQNILGWSKNLFNFFVREKNSIAQLSDEFKEIFDLGIIEAINEINRDIKFISDVLEKGEKGLVLNDYEKEIIPLAEINNIINTLSSNEFKFSIKKQLLEVDEMEARGILISRVLFKTLLDNLFTNANKYGFKVKSQGNHVMVELSEIDNYLIVEVSNNGFPFPKNFDREKFITKYSTADVSNGSGLGGYDINRIATYFENENWELILNADPIYPVIFRFSFPIKFLR